MDEVKALEAGADDYIRESAGIVDMVARLVAVVRRTQRAFSPESRILSNGPLTMDPATYEVFLHGSRLTLTPTEFRLLHLFLENRGNVLTRQYIAGSLWGDEVDSTVLVKKYVQRLRRRLNDTAENPRWITNIHGIGYKIVAHQKQETEDTRVPELVAS